MTPCPHCHDTGVIEQVDTHDTDIFPCRCQEETMSEQPTPAAQIAPDGREVIYTAIRAYIDGNPFFLNTVEREANAIYDAIYDAGLAIVPAADPEQKKRPKPLTVKALTGSVYHYSSGAYSTVEYLRTHGLGIYRIADVEGWDE